MQVLMLGNEDLSLEFIEILFGVIKKQANKFHALKDGICAGRIFTTCKCFNSKS